MQDHIRKVICGGNDADSEYLLNSMFQQPNKPAEVVVVLRGKKGTGKGVLLSWLVRAWGQHGLHISNAKHLVGNFNAHLRDCVMLFADEAFYAGDRQHESVLKALVTEYTLPIEAKHQNLVEVVNMLHVYMASNLDWVVPASLEERRYFVLDVADNRLGDREIFLGTLCRDGDRRSGRNDIRHAAPRHSWLRAARCAEHGRTHRPEAP